MTEGEKIGGAFLALAILGGGGFGVYRYKHRKATALGAAPTVRNPTVVPGTSAAVAQASANAQTTANTVAQVAAVAPAAANALVSTVGALSGLFGSGSGDSTSDDSDSADAGD